MRRFLNYILLGLFLFAAGFVYWRYYWVFGEGVKAGELNYVVKKGFVFKTYEGKLIQSGFKGGVAGSIQSYEFEFSVTDEKIANQLMSNSGKTFDLHYTEYLGALPWRGNSNFIVDSVLSTSPENSDKSIDPKAH